MFIISLNHQPVSVLLLLAISRMLVKTTILLIVLFVSDISTIYVLILRCLFRYRSQISYRVSNLQLLQEGLKNWLNISVNFDFMLNFLYYLIWIKSFLFNFACLIANRLKADLWFWSIKRHANSRLRTNLCDGQPARPLFLLQTLFEFLHLKFPPL